MRAILPLFPGTLLTLTGALLIIFGHEIPGGLVLALGVLHLSCLEISYTSSRERSP